MLPAPTLRCAAPARPSRAVDPPVHEAVKRADAWRVDLAGEGSPSQPSRHACVAENAKAAPALGGAVWKYPVRQACSLNRGVLSPGGRAGNGSPFRPTWLRQGTESGLIDPGRVSGRISLRAVGSRTSAIARSSGSMRNGEGPEPSAVSRRHLQQSQFPETRRSSTPGQWITTQVGVKALARLAGRRRVVSVEVTACFAIRKPRHRMF